MASTKDIELITEGEEVVTFEGDKLDQIFQGQKFLMRNYKTILEEKLFQRYGVHVNLDQKVFDGGEFNLHTSLGNEMIYKMITAAIQELAESIQVMKNWKDWKLSEIPTDVEHFKEEMVDALHFFIEALVFSGVTPEELYELYFKKHKVNQFRQKTNY